ncbi:hypothetical protein ACROYT_G037597 [Oculina patagonica]
MDAASHPESGKRKPTDEQRVNEMHSVMETKPRKWNTGGRERREEDATQAAQVAPLSRGKKTARTRNRRSPGKRERAPTRRRAATPSNSAEKKEKEDTLTAAKRKCRTKSEEPQEPAPNTGRCDGGTTTRKRHPDETPDPCTNSTSPSRPTRARADRRERNTPAEKKTVQGESAKATMPKPQEPEPRDRPRAAVTNREKKHKGDRPTQRGGGVRAVEGPAARKEKRQKRPNTRRPRADPANHAQEGDATEREGQKEKEEKGQTEPEAPSESTESKDSTQSTRAQNPRTRPTRTDPTRLETVRLGRTSELPQYHPWTTQRERERREEKRTTKEAHAPRRRTPGHEQHGHEGKKRREERQRNTQPRPLGGGGEKKRRRATGDTATRKPVRRGKTREERRESEKEVEWRWHRGYPGGIRVSALPWS